MFILGIWLRPRSQGAEASAVVYYGALDWEIALKLPIVIVPSSQLPLTRAACGLKAKFRIDQKILTALVDQRLDPIMSGIRHEMPRFHASGPV